MAGDPYERHADEVADAVSAGRTAEGILDRFAAPRSTSYLQARAAVQRKVVIGGKVARSRTMRRRTQLIATRCGSPRPPAPSALTSAISRR